MLAAWQMKLFQWFNMRIYGPALTKIGFRLNTLGNNLYPQLGFQEKLFPSPNNSGIAGKHPNGAKALFIGPSSHIRGNVELELKSVVMFNSVVECIPLTGNESLRIGKNSLIQDLTTVRAWKGKSTSIGNNCLVGSNSMVENSVIEDDVYIGPACRIVNSVIRRGAYLAPGTWVVNGEVAERQVVCKNPGEVLREVSNKEVEYLQERIKEGIELAIIIGDFHVKNGAEVDVETPLEVQENDGALEDFEYQYEKYRRHLQNMNVPSAREDLYYANYRAWLLENIESRKTFGYKKTEFDPTYLDQRPDSVYGSFKEDLQKQLKMHERGLKNMGKLIEPNFSYDQDNIDYKQEIQRRQESNKKF
jgi:carbonic anhydrase/acetyltransferase-like protein (isoleucine patch superfamily)